MSCRVGTQLLSILALGFMSPVTPATMSFACKISLWTWAIVIFLGLWVQNLVNSNTFNTCIPLNSFDLELYRNNIGGKIPKELGNLKSLISMDLYGNKFEGEIPKSFAKLKSLRFLRLNNNNLQGPIPRELTTLTDLKIFDVSNNDLCGTIPVDGPFGNFRMESHVPVNQDKKRCGESGKGSVKFSSVHHMARSTCGKEVAWNWEGGISGAFRRNKSTMGRNLKPEMKTTKAAIYL
ncbi:hypothetical protein TEA_012301 [Camellia sinensis var. sinensis]|uniref:Leucine-rich repeat-containing N-terminal plant-type domain-containing protein n=1 Tax=Camellia sinensis var. sinensis TaxID=542762 RepID=A0A4S4D4B3_CAMSN|nr:hypothetical protein TEA_012301 [Camellia sinensis var. sinensis]